MFRSKEILVINDAAEFRAAHEQLTKEVNALKTKKRMIDIFNMAKEHGEENSPASTTLNSKNGQEDVSVRIGEGLDVNRKPGNYSFKNSARIIITNHRQEIIHELNVQQAHTNEWSVDYLDHAYKNGHHSYSWRHANPKSNQFSPEQAYLEIPELETIETILQKAA